MKWFERHLNWTYLIGYMLATLVYYGVSMILAWPNIDLEVELIALVPLGATSIWVLHKKGRNLWWTLACGWGSPLWLGNERRDN